MPQSVLCDDQRYELVETFKHDFFAATGLYRGPAGLCVLKLGRTSDLGILPLAWVGRWLTRREAGAYEALQDVAGIPAYVGRVGPNGFLHAFVPGHPLGRDERVSDSFFDELEGFLQMIHDRGMAYVDLNKRENVLVGEDGRPYLIDFQISLRLPRRLGGSLALPLRRWLLSRFQQADRYHFAKHKRRLRPDLLTVQERARVERLSIWIRLHRRIAGPITRLRRRTLGRLKKSETLAVAGSNAK